MKRCGLLLGLALLSSVHAVQAYPGQVLRKFAAPGQFGTGLCYDGRYLWMADYKSDRLYKIDPATGKKVSDIPSPGFWPMGLAYDGQNLWNIDGRQKKIFKVDPQSGAILTAIDSPSGSPEGLAWDGETLWLSDAREKSIMRLDLDDGTAVRIFAAPAQSPQGLAWDGTYLWCADRLSDELHMIDPRSGEVIIVAKSPGPFPRGLAYDGTYLWNLDYQNDEIYQLVRQDLDFYRLDNPRTSRITLTHQANVYGQGRLQQLDVYLAIPEDRPGQAIFRANFTPGDPQRVKDRWGQTFAHFCYQNKRAETQLTSIMEVEARISDIRYFIFPDRCGTLADVPPEIRDAYTSNGSKYLLDDPYIRNLAKQIVGDETNPYWMARRIFDYVRNALEYKMEGGWNAAPVVLQRGTGSCSEYSFSFIALCRAVGLPARYVGAIVVRGDDASYDEDFHRWPEVYLPNYGWVPMDPQGGDKPSARDRALNIGNLSNRFLITTVGGGDSEYIGWTYNSSETYTCDAQVKVELESFGEWQPITIKK